ncbi:MAG: SpoIIE family protein phosphatase [Leptospirales bacterium]|jgi:HAMP domain-containing protein
MPSIYMNAWGIATLVCSVFTLILVVFLFSLNSRLWYTRALAMMYVGAFVMDLGFFLGAVFPEPIGAYHRYLTVPGALIGAFFLSQFAFAYPRQFKSKFARVYVFWFLTILCGIVAVGLTALFIIQTFGTKPNFVLAGQVFNFSKEAGRSVARGILFQVFVFLIVSVVKCFQLKGDERRTMIQMTIALLLATLGPGIVNLFHQRDALSHETFQQFFVLFTLVSYFVFTIVFINNTVDRTSFMTKILGISVVTMLLVIQAMSTVVTLQQEKHFDQIHSKNSHEYLLNGELPVDAAYVLSYPGRNAGVYDARELQNPDQIEIPLKVFQAELVKAIASGEFAERQARVINALNPELPDDVYYSYFFRDHDEDRIIEVGYPYTVYREFIDATSRNIAYLALALVFVILVLYPIFFSRSLVRPLNNLLEGVGEVNTGNLLVKIPVMVQDEIGYLSESFNRMVKSILDSKNKLQEHADTLEEKVEERTRDLNAKMEEVQALKVQQDGDYFLTALINKPLMTNWNKSRYVGTEFYVEQKKKFAFRERDSELGGDICITGNLRFKNDSDRWVLFVNGDAMGKSMQGAGGAIVLGTSMNNILSRSAGQNRVIEESPEQWLTDVYFELHNVFLTFDGMMMASVAMGLIHETTGRMLYVNAEHPWSAIYRDGKAHYIEDELVLRKLGSPSEFEFRLQQHQLQAGDVLFAGSDGREDLDLTPGQSKRTINEDNDVFLRFIEKAGGDLAGVVDQVHGFGAITDDLSILRIGFQELSAPMAVSRAGAAGADAGHPGGTAGRGANGGTAEILGQARAKFAAGRQLLENGDADGAIARLKEATELAPDYKDPLRMLGQVHYDRREFEAAVPWFESFLELDNDAANVWFLLSICFKQARRFEDARNAGEKVRELQPHRTANLINLSDSYRVLGDAPRARKVIEEALKIEPDSRAAQQVDGLLKSKGH